MNRTVVLCAAATGVHLLAAVAVAAVARRKDYATLIPLGAGIFLILGMLFAYELYRSEKFWLAFAKLGITYTLVCFANAVVGVELVKKLVPKASLEVTMIWLAPVLYVPGLWLLAGLLRVLLKKSF